MMDSPFFFLDQSPGPWTVRRPLGRRINEDDTGPLPGCSLCGGQAIDQLPLLAPLFLFFSFPHLPHPLCPPNPFPVLSL